MLITINAPPISRILGIAKEYKWLDKKIHALTSDSQRLSEMNYYPIEPKDWHDPDYDGINIIIRDFVYLDNMDSEMYERLIGQGLIDTPRAIVYDKLHHTFDRIFSALEPPMSRELDILFPLPWGCPEGQSGIFSTLHGVLQEEFNIIEQKTVFERSTAIAIKYAVSEKSLMDKSDYNPSKMIWGNKDDTNNATDDQMEKTGSDTDPESETNGTDGNTEDEKKAEV